MLLPHRNVISRKQISYKPSRMSAGVPRQEKWKEPCHCCRRGCMVRRGGAAQTASRCSRATLALFVIAADVWYIYVGGIVCSKVLRCTINRRVQFACFRVLRRLAWWMSISRTLKSSRGENQAHSSSCLHSTGFLRRTTSFPQISESI